MKISVRSHPNKTDKMLCKSAQIKLEFNPAMLDSMGPFKTSNNCKDLTY